MDLNDLRAKWPDICPVWPQAEIDEAARELSPWRSRPGAPEKEEDLPLYDSGGQPVGTSAPRWLCHFLGLRHRCAHVLLLWESPALGRVMVLQMRSWTKVDSPGRLDISVGGHTTTAGGTETALTEMLEETGLAERDLSGPLEYLGGYSYDEARPAEEFYNSEWRDVYAGRISPDGLSRLHFPDGEVAGVALIPLAGAHALLEQRVTPVASGLAGSLPRCLEWLSA